MNILTWFLTIILTTLFFQGHAQTLQGAIVNQLTWEPLKGATINYNGATAISNDNGEFSIPIGGVKHIHLGVTAVGFERRDTTILTTTDEPVIISLSPAENLLEEVVVSTGYQRLPRDRATGSFGFIDNKVFNEQVGSDVLGRLEAIANGFQVDRTGSADKLLIRGLSTIEGSTQPLIVLDNFPYEGDLNNINPNDVESITILKDAAAASIWGARAGNGVIVITTKKGKLKQPLAIEFNSNVSISAKPDLFYRTEISSSDFIDVERMLYDEGYYTAQINSRYKPALSPVVELLIQRESASTGAVAAIDAEIERLRGIDVRNDFIDHIYQQSQNQQYYLGLRNGSDLMAWNLAAGYDKSVDQLDAFYDRISLRANHTVKPWKNLSLSSDLSYTLSHTRSGRSGYGQITSMNNGLFPYAELADEEGNALALIKQVRKAYLDEEVDNRLLDWRYYPLDDFKHSSNTSSTASLLANVGLKYSLPLGFGFSANYQYERQQRNGRNTNGEKSFFVRDLVNRFTQTDSDGGMTRAVPYGGIMDHSESLLQAHNLRGQVSFDKDWAIHSLSFIAGGELRTATNSGNHNRFYGYDNDILIFGNVDYTTQYADYLSGQGSFIPDQKMLSRTDNRYASFYSNAAYTYVGRYTLSLSGRRDASNLFGLNTNDKWNLLWSAGLAWEISKEKSYSLAWLPKLKLRSTYGHSGNVNPDMVALTTMQYRPNLAANTQTPYARFTNFANPELAWETVGTMNIGLDFALPKNRVRGTVEYYRKNGRNLYGPAPVDYTTGIGYTITKNVASMIGSGWDIDLNSINLNGKFNWQSHLNLSFNREKVTSYYLPDRRGNRFVAYATSISGIEGKPVRSIFSYRWAGLDPETGAPRGFVDGTPSTDYRQITGNDVLVDDLVYHGSSLPTCFGSLGNTFAYRGFHLTVRLSYKFGYFFRRETIRYSQLFSSWQGHGDFYHRWQHPGDEQTTNVPAMIYPLPSRSENFYPFAEPFVEPGDHIRLQYVNLGYEFTRAMYRGLPFERIGLYFNFSNLGLLWKAIDEPIDPDFSSAATTGIPQPFSFTFGLRFDL